jgi:hypothetical protein
MASTTVITAFHLSQAGITDAALVTALTGVTVAAAAEEFQVIYSLAMVNAAVQRTGLVRYMLQGQSSEFSMDQLKTVMDMLAAMKSLGGRGPVSCAVTLP